MLSTFSISFCSIRFSTLSVLIPTLIYNSRNKYGPNNVFTDSKLIVDQTVLTIDV